MIDFNTFKKLPQNLRDLGTLIVAKGFKKLAKVQLIAQSGHTENLDHKTRTKGKNDVAKIFDK